MSINRFYEPEPSLEPPEPKIIGYCSVCGGEIYDGETYYTDGPKMIHGGDNDEDCLNDMWRELSADEKADILGLVKGDM